MRTFTQKSKAAPQIAQSTSKASTKSANGDSAPANARFSHDFSRIPTTRMTNQPMTTTGGDHEQAEDKRASNNNRAELLKRAGATSGSPVDAGLRQDMEQQLKVPLGNVRVHQGPASRAAAANISARAFTVGSNIHLGAEAEGMVGEQRRALLFHEVVHTAQQGSRPVPLGGRITVNSPNDPAETEAADIAAAATKEPSIASASPALELRNSMRTTNLAPCIQRDIKGDKTFGTGKFEIDFTKNDAAAAGDNATEDGTVTFTPSVTAPESSSIRFVQIVRTVDVAGVTAKAGADLDWAKAGGGGEAPRNAQLTGKNAIKNTAGGFFVDQVAASLAKRTKKADAAVLPYYDAMLANPGNQIGKRQGKTVVPAILDDHPGVNGAVKFNFVTSAKASDTGTWYGSVLWGFETFLDKGIAKIQNEYHSFRPFRGETTDAALKKFNEFYRNPGAGTAPTK